ncbi:MAG: hypothetical protein SWN98_07955, partial [Pseudomonadota bacterium]|nr:hypothetical protein [Pseudomonadota bacterium]
MLSYIPDDAPLAQWATQRNLARQYDFMNTAFSIWKQQGEPRLSLEFLKELNFYAAHLLSPHPGQFRNEFKKDVDITNTPHTPPKWQEVEGLMADFL